MWAVVVAALSIVVNPERTKVGVGMKQHCAAVLITARARWYMRHSDKSEGPFGNPEVEQVPPALDVPEQLLKRQTEQTPPPTHTQRTMQNLPSSTKRRDKSEVGGEAG